MASVDKSNKPKWTFYHIICRWGTLGSIFVKNQTLEQILLRHVCPFVDGEPYPTSGGGIVNPRAFFILLVYGTDKPIDSTWPPLQSADRSDDSIIEYLDANGHNCSGEAYRAAALLVQTGVYVSAKAQVARALDENFVFVISQIGEPEVDTLYDQVIKPQIKAHGYEPARADELLHTDLITNAIIGAIARARFIVADLTSARPNCYYEVGYAHALGKPCILLAKEGTERHFDVSGYRWNHWKPGMDFGPAFDRLLTGVLENLAESNKVRPNSDSQ
jgi:hypothetical protein